MKRFEGKVAIVTGGANGIGSAISKRLASEGARVVIADVDADALQRTQAEITQNGVCTCIEVGHIIDKKMRGDGARPCPHHKQPHPIHCRQTCLMRHTWSDW